MNLGTIVRAAASKGASDLHLEPGMPATIRVRGSLKPVGEPVPVETLVAIARELLEGDAWSAFKKQRSADFARTIEGVRCRLNVMTTTRGVGLAIRILPSAQPSLETLNLHPDLARLVRENNGLIVIAGPTGSGKSSTLAALIHEINSREARHIVTLERPIEFNLRPRNSLIRQREVGIDTPTFEQGLLDAMREDPDVLMVGEMREATTMRQTLSAAETGHLVLTTVHSANVVEALHRIVSAFPSEIQPMVCAQLADSLLAVVSQRLTYRSDLGIRIPECEILVNTMPIKAMIRQGHFFKLQTPLETGARDGQFSRERYRAWLGKQQHFHKPSRSDVEPPAPAQPPPRPEILEPQPAPKPEPKVPAEGKAPEEDVIVIKPPTQSLSDIIDELD